MTPEEVKDITARLSEPFDPNVVKYRPGATSGNRALALAYIDARIVQDRLDEVLGPTGWQDDYEALASGEVMCRLKLFIDGQWIQKSDVGGQSEQPDEGDRMKSAFSDALKRAAVKFGIGRYLYRLPAQWVDFDPQKKQLKAKPRLPDWAQPGGKPTQQEQPIQPPRQQEPKNGQQADQEPGIDGEQARAILAALKEAGIVTSRGTPDYSGLFAYCEVERFGQIPAKHFAAIIADIKARAPRILPKNTK